VSSTHGQQCPRVWCFKNIVSSFLYIVRCPECTGTAVSVILVFQEHRQQFSVYSPVSSTHGQQCPTDRCCKNIVSSSVYCPVSRVHSVSSVSQSGVSRTSSAVLYIVRCPAHSDSTSACCNTPVCAIQLQWHIREYCSKLTSNVR